MKLIGKQRDEARVRKCDNANDRKEASGIGFEQNPITLLLEVMTVG